jgi:hypothetical protein
LSRKAIVEQGNPIIVSISVKVGLLNENISLNYRFDSPVSQEDLKVLEGDLEKVLRVLSRHEQKSCTWQIEQGARAAQGTVVDATEHALLLIGEQVRAFLNLPRPKAQALPNDLSILLF